METDSALAVLRDEHPELGRIAAASGDPVYAVGGVVRDALLGRERSDVDVVVLGDAAALARALGAPLAEHDRFGTAKVELAGREVDVAAARAETYPHPGALPVVRPAESIEADLGRRDFTINAMAIPLDGEPALVDPHGGRADLDAGLIRVLHERSFLDDPTRAVRAARYAARFGFGLEPETERLLRATDLGSVSADRRRAELLRLAAEPSGVEGLALLAEWGVIVPREGGIELARRVVELLEAEPWRGQVDAAEAILTAALAPHGGETRVAEWEPGSPSEAVEAAKRHDLVELLLARALGAEWLDEYVGTWRSVELEIGGEDLIAAGVPEGPAVGRGLAAALRRRLDGELDGREEELAAALAAARAEG